MIEENIEGINQNKEPTHYIKEYAVLEHLGSGAFGSVYKVRRQHGESTPFYAIKEISTLQATLGRNAKERDKSVGEIISELTIIKVRVRASLRQSEAGRRIFMKLLIVKSKMI